MSSSCPFYDWNNHITLEIPQNTFRKNFLPVTIAHLQIALLRPVEKLLCFTAELLKYTTGILFRKNNTRLCTADQYKAQSGHAKREYTV